MIRYFLFFTLFLLTSCHRESWQHTSIRNGNRDYDIAKLSYPPSNPNSGIKLEFTRFGKEIHGYINVATFEFPTHKDDLHATTLTISTNSTTRTFVISLLEGGQRARLTDTCLDYLIQTLQLKSSVTLSSGHFSETLESSNFERHYNVLLREPSRIKPQNLIHFELF